MFETEINDVPCLIDVFRVLIVPPNPNSWDSDVDYFGQREIEFEVLKLNGKPYPWLAAQITPEIRDRIEDEVLENS